MATVGKREDDDGSATARQRGEHDKTERVLRSTDYCAVGRQRSAVLWVCHAIQQLGGSYLGDGRFSFASERQRRIALKVLSDLFDPRFFEPVDSDAPPSLSRG